MTGLDSMIIDFRWPSLSSRVATAVRDAMQCMACSSRPPLSVGQPPARLWQALALVSAQRLHHVSWQQNTPTGASGLQPSCIYLPDPDLGLFPSSGSLCDRGFAPSENSNAQHYISQVSTQGSLIDTKHGLFSRPEVGRGANF
jgi:hypothetical protein